MLSGRRAECSFKWERTVKRLLLALTITGALASPAQATDLEDGLRAFNRGEHVVPYKILRPLAERGNAQAQFWVGHMFRTGQGTKEDRTEAVRWYRLGAEQGNRDAQYMLGFVYAEGLGVPQDYEESAEWFLRATKQGDISAQTALGMLYADGDGVPKDHGKSQHWYRKAADGYRGLAGKGDGSAMLSLYLAHMKGNGVPQDRETAYMWLILAEQAGDQTAEVFLKFHALTSKFTAQQIDKGKKRAKEWLREHE